MLILASADALAATFHASPSDDVEAVINTLGPGDELILADGTYTLTERFSFDLTGTEQAPILIRAAEGATPHFHRPNASQNIWDIKATWTTIRGLEFSGGSAGLRFEAAANMTLEGCDIHDTADVAVRMNDAGQTYDTVQILNNHIHHTSGTGEGMYLGCNSNGCRLANALIANNYVHHTDGAGVSQGDGIELKEGSYGCTIRDNVIHNTKYPCILIYSTAGNGAPNVVERNVLWACGDNGIQAAADAVIENNIILEAAYEGIALQAHQAGSPSNLVIRHNTVLQAGQNAIALRGVTGSVVIANNALYAQAGAAINPVNGDFSQVVVSGNVGVGGVAGGQYSITEGNLAADFVDAHWAGAPPINLYPKAGGALVAGGDATHVVAVDFDGTDRLGEAHAGAYHFSAQGSPGWVIAEAFKNLSGEGPADGGVDGGDLVDGGVDGVGPNTDAGISADARTDAGNDTGSCQTCEPCHDDGCGCHTHPTQPSSWFLFLALAGLAIIIRRRR